MTPIKNLPPNRLVCLIAEVPHMLLKLAPAGLLARSGAGDLVVHDEGQYLTARCSKEQFERVTG